MPTLQHITYSLKGGESHKLAYWQHGSAGNLRVALCMHGLTRNGRDFDFLARELAETHRVICPDMPGRGKSDWLDNTQHYNYDTYRDVILTLLDTLQIDQVDWIGTSMGGILGMRVAAEVPDRVRSLLLNDIGAVIPVAGLSRINQYVGITMDFSGRAEAEAYLQEIFAQFGIHDAAHWQHLLEHSFTRMSNDEYQLAYDPGILDPLRDNARKLKSQEDTLLWGWWDAIKCPALILRGEESDILSDTVASEMVSRHPYTSYVELNGMGHAPALMDDAQIRLVQDWLERRPLEMPAYGRQRS